MTDRPSIKDINPDRFDRRPQRGRKNKVYQDKIMKIAKDAKDEKGKAKAKETMEKFLKSIKGEIPAAGLKKLAADAIMGVDDMKKNAPGGIDSKINKDGRLYNKGGRVKKQVKKKTGKLALRGYGISR